MPHRKHRSYKGRSRPQRRAITYGQIGSKIYRDVAKLKRLINVEYKSHLFGLSSVASTTPNIQNVTAIAQGDTFSQRDGNKIRSFSLSFRGHVRQNPSATLSFARVMLIRDNNGSTTQPVLADLFSDAASFYDNRHKLDDPQTNSRFTVLFDQHFGLSAVGPEILEFEWYTKLDHHIFFTGTAATDEGKGAIYSIIGSNEATNTVVVDADTVYKFIDN